MLTIKLVIGDHTWITHLLLVVQTIGAAVAVLLACSSRTRHAARLVGPSMFLATIRTNCRLPSRRRHRLHRYV